MIQEQLFGTDLTSFLTSTLFCVIGMIISLLLSTTSRNIESERTPFHFDFIFWLSDNWKRLILNTLLIYVTIRFYGDIMGGAKLTPFISLSVGMGFDRIIALIKSKTEFFDAKDKKTD